MTANNATNGHPTNPRPGDLTPALRPVKRTLYVEEEDNGITSAWEATDQDLLDECLRRGLLTDEQCREMLSGSETDSGTEHEIPVNGFDGQLGTAHEEGKREVVGTTPAGGEVTVGCPGCGATGAIVDHECQPLEAKLPSERIVELHRERIGDRIEPGSVAEACGWQVALVAMYLDERLGRAP